MEFEGTVHCVGIVANAERQYLVLACETKKRPIAFYVTVLDDNSAPLVSPLFEHTVALAEEAGEEDKVEREYVIYRLVEWRAAVFRLASEPSGASGAAEYAKRLRDLIKHTFFPLLRRSSAAAAVTDWQRAHFNWHTYRRGMGAVYREEFRVGEWLAKELTPAQYWSSFNARFGDAAQAALKALDLDAKLLRPHDRGYLYCLLDAWRENAHLAAYFKYRLLEMETAREVCAARASPVRCCALSTERLRDLAALYRELAALRAGELGEVEEYNDFPLLCAVTIRPAALPALLQHFFPAAPDDEAAEGGQPAQREPAQRLRHAVIDTVLVRRIALEAERGAAEALSTVAPISAKSLLYAYRRMVGLRQPAEEAMSELTLCGPATGANRAGMDFLEEDGAEVVNQFVNSLRCAGRVAEGDQGDQRRARLGLAYEWRDCAPPRDEHQCVTVKLTTPLFLVLARPEANAREAALRALTTQETHCQVTTLESAQAAEWDAAAWRRECEALDPVDAALYDFRVTALLFRPLELARGDDMPPLYAALRDNIFTCALVRPRGSDFSLRRASLYFHALPRRKGEMSLVDLHERFFDSAHAVLAPGAVRETVVLMDCHLLALDELLALFQWAARHRAVVKRLVMLGARDMLPLGTEGQAWLDFLLWHRYCFAKFRAAPLNEDHTALLDAALAQHRVSLCESPLGIQELLVAHMRRAEARPEVLHLYCVWCCAGTPAGGGTGAKRRREASLERVVEDALSVKFRDNYNVRVEAITLSQCTTLPLARQSADGLRHARFFFVARRELRALARNEANHLVVDTAGEPLVVLCGEDEAPPPNPASFSWFRKSLATAQQYPNSRYTAQYAHELKLEL